MKLILFLGICLLALRNGKGAPKFAVYKFVRCNPESDQANCVTQRSPQMAWSPDLPSKLPASTARYLEAEPEEGESPLREEDVEYDREEEGGESPAMEDYAEFEKEEEGGESPPVEEEVESEGGWVSPVEPDEGSGGYEGSAADSTFFADWAFAPAEAETGSGESRTEELYKVGDLRGLRRLFPSRPRVGEAKPAEQELKEDHLLQL